MKNTAFLLDNLQKMSGALGDSLPLSSSEEGETDEDSDDEDWGSDPNYDIDDDRPNGLQSSQTSMLNFLNNPKRSHKKNEGTKTSEHLQKPGEMRVKNCNGRSVMPKDLLSRTQLKVRRKQNFDNLLSSIPRITDIFRKPIPEDPALELEGKDEISIASSSSSSSSSFDVSPQTREVNPTKRSRQLLSTQHARDSKSNQEPEEQSQEFSRVRDNCRSNVIKAYAALQAINRSRKFLPEQIQIPRDESNLDVNNFLQDPLLLQMANVCETFLSLLRDGYLYRDAEEQVARLQSSFAGSTVRAWAKEFCKLLKFKLSMRGRHSKTPSYIDDPQFRLILGLHIEEVTWPGKGKKRMTVSSLCNNINQMDHVKRMYDKVTAERLAKSDYFDLFGETKEEEQGEKRLTLEEFIKKAVDQTSTHHPICERTASNWLHALGYRLKTISKCVYFDGHEREDVVADRNRYCNRFLGPGGHAEYMSRYEGPQCDQLIPGNKLQEGEKERVLMVQDEMCVKSAQGDSHYWGKDGGRNVVPPKSEGSFVMISAFISEKVGYLRCSKEVFDEYWSRNSAELISQGFTHPPPSSLVDDYYESKVQIEPGAALNKDAYWNNAQFIEQERWVVPLFEACHPNSILVQGIDHSTNHAAMAQNALIAEKMGKMAGGAQPTMRDAVFKNSKGEEKKQSMVFVAGECLLKDVSISETLHEDDDNDGKEEKEQAASEEPKKKRAKKKNSYKKGEILGPNHFLVGKAKGLEYTLYERNIDTRKLKANCLPGKKRERKKNPSVVVDHAEDGKCCMVKIMSTFSDFQSETSVVAALLASRGHILEMIPKYHCELNAIEYIWCNVKSFTRSYCDQSITGLRKNLEKAFKDPNIVGVTRVRKCFRRSWRFLQCYQAGLTVGQASACARQQAHHRTITAEMLREFQAD